MTIDLTYLVWILSGVAGAAWVIGYWQGSRYVLNRLRKGRD